MAEGARLESVYAGNRIEGSNPSPSATTPFCLILLGRLWRRFLLQNKDFINFLIALDFFRLCLYCLFVWYLTWYD